MEEYTLVYRGHNNCLGECQVDIYRQTGLVVATNTGPGVSRSADAVTNACEIIANQVVAQYNVDPQKMIFIERYHPGTREQTTDLVKFDFADGKAFRFPKWTHIPREDFEKMVNIARETE